MRPLQDAGQEAGGDAPTARSRGEEEDVSAAAAAAGREQDWGATERMLLMALEQLYKDAAEPDVRAGLLRACIHILHRHGALPQCPPLPAPESPVCSGSVKAHGFNGADNACRMAAGDAQPLSLLGVMSPET